MNGLKPIVSMLDLSVYQMVSLRPDKLFPDPMNNDCNKIEIDFNSLNSMLGCIEQSKIRNKILV